MLIGPLRGDPAKVKQRFEEARREANILCDEVVNPLISIPLRGKKTWFELVIRNMRLLKQVDAVYLMANWRRDGQCKILFMIAEELKLQILLQEFPAGEERNAIMRRKR